MSIPHRYRQVHLDFHTGPDCQNVGADFDPQVFVDTLQMGHVDTINIFAKCHHGYSYYPTQVGTMHPNLTRDLLGEQVKALHAANIRCPIYISVKWDDLAGMQHPEWVVINKDGTANMRPPLSNGWGWSTMDVSSGYADYFLAQVDEVCNRFAGQLDGLWFDICFPTPNYSPSGQAKMRAAGVNISDDRAVYAFWRQQDLAFFQRVTDLVERKAPGITYYFNGTTTADMREVLPYVTHFEVESLPTSGGAWGYLHYPTIGRQARTYGVDMIGMTGRFHKAWADFGGLKTQDQLDYECGTILAGGGRICVGDQLHPRGVLDPAVYRLIGKSFARVEKLEPWMIDAVPTAEVAILALGKPNETGVGVGAYASDVDGAAQMLLECAIQFDIVDPQADFSRYAALIVPDGVSLSDELQASLHHYLAQGGKLVISGTGGYDAQAGKFQLSEIPVETLIEAPTQPTYLRLDAHLATTGELATDYDYVFYEPAYQVKAVAGVETHGELKRALFTRTWEHFTSHAHAPVGDSLQSPLVVQSHNVLYLAAPLFSAYRNHDYWAYRAIFASAVRNFFPPAQLIPTGPGWVEFTAQTQPAGKGHPARQIVYVVAYHPRRTTQPVQHVDQSWPTSGLAFRLKAAGDVQRVYLAPEMQDLPFEVAEGYIKVELPPVNAYSVVVVE